MLSGNVTYFCEYGRYFLIGYYLSKINNFLLLVECTKGNMGFDRISETNDCCVKRDLRVNLSTQSEGLNHGSN